MKRGCTHTITTNLYIIMLLTTFKRSNSKNNVYECTNIDNPVLLEQYSKHDNLKKIFRKGKGFLIATIIRT